MGKKMTLTFRGCDDWDRPVYDFDGQLYVDVDPRAGSRPAIHTKNNNDFYGEPNSPVADDIEIEFAESRVVWD